MLQPASLSDLPAFLCGHAHDAAAATGCTVVIAPEGGVCGVDVRGGGPATRETDLLKPENMIQAVHAVVLSGGSAFGLAASTGVMEELAEREIGFPVESARVPIVCGACLFDLLVGKNAHPDAAMGRAAARAAFERKATEPLEEGNVGAGCGATVGKLLGGDRAMKAGLGICGLRMGDVVAVAIVAVNALGNVCESDGTWIAGCRGANGLVMEPLDALTELASRVQDDGSRAVPSEGPCPNTTIGLVLTNARITKAQATKVSSTVHDAYARAIKPVHTSGDGDTVFTFSSCEAEADYDLVAMLATEAMQGAIVRAVQTAQGAHGLPCARDIATR